MRWMRRGLMLVVLLAIARWPLCLVYRQRVLPQTDGTLQLRGPTRRGAHRARRATASRPSAPAARDDAAFGLGFVHAQDRLWQLETHRRIGAGRLAEAFGAPALETDRFLRALGVRRAAAAQWARMRAAVARSVLQAYADGINASCSRALRARPPEFLILGLQPEPWTPGGQPGLGDHDGLGPGRQLEHRAAAHAPGAADCRSSASTSCCRRTRARSRCRRPTTRRCTARSKARRAALGGRLALLPRAPESGVEGVGSNNWVLAGSHTTTGKPLLANDPHLKLSAPALWYFARLEAPGFKVAGATMPGLPAVVLGQNEHIAWGFTNTGPDVQDLYLERIKPDDPTPLPDARGLGARSRPSTETIKVKGQPDVPITVRAHAPRPGDLRRRRWPSGLTGPASRAGLRAGAALDGAGPRRRHARRRAWPCSRRRSVAEFIDAHARATSRRCRTWWWPTATATSAWSRRAACRCASPTTT